MSHRYPAFDGTQACLDSDPATLRAFAEAADADLEQARAVCRGCRFRPACLDYAVHTDVAGIWAGTTTGERATIRGRDNVDPPPSISDELDAWVITSRASRGAADQRPRRVAA